MKQIIFFCLVLVFGQSFAWGEIVHVMTWNIRYDDPNDGVNRWVHRKDWLAGIVVESRADVVGFQEVLVGQMEDLKSRLPELEGYAVGRDDGQDAGEFSPVFYRKSRFELLDKSTFWLSPTPETIGSKGWDAALPRIASWVKLKDRTNGTVFFVINTHMDHRGAQARTESAALLSRRTREQFVGHPVILIGDFNATPDSAPYRVLTDRSELGQPMLYDTYKHSALAPFGPNSTWNGFKEIVLEQRIDFIFATKEVKTLSVQIRDDQHKGRFPSDHLPVVAELEIPSRP